MSKVLIVGLDGASWEILSLLIDNGSMPYLKGLVDNGASGILRSAIPPVTACAWTTFQTGVNPGKHGIIDFRSFDPTTKQLRLVNASDIKMKTIWELAGEHKKKVIAINVPLTYPPKKVNGIIVGGMLSPKADERMVYPREIYNKFMKKEGYRITVGRLEQQALMPLKDFIDEAIEVEEKRFSFAKKLMKEYEWSLFMVHNQTMDHIQHLFYSYLNPASENYDEKKNKDIVRFYEASDRFLREIAEEAGEEAAIILMSDHGASEVSHYVNVNAWLLKKGYLALTYKQILAHMITLIRRWDKASILKRILGRFVKRDALIAEINRNLSNNFVNWQRSRAFMVNGCIWGNIYCPRREALPGLIEDLKIWRNPVNGENIIKNIYKKDEIFSGPHVEFLPDLFLEPHKGYSFYAPLIKNMEMFHKADSKRYDLIGTHDINGIFVMRGRGVALRKGIYADIVDVAPTVLSLLKVPIPNYMDGRVIEEAFTERPRVEMKDEGVPTDTNSADYEEADAKEIENRLRDLGYL